MMKRLPFMLAALFALAISTAHAAPSIESTPAPMPKKPNFAPFAFYVGTWTCTTTMANRPGPETSTETWSLDDTGYWMTSNGDSPPVKWFPYDSKSMSRITYDSDAKLWVFMYSDSLGDYGLSTSPGWKGSTAVWTARSFFPTQDVTAVSTFTIKKISDNQYVSTYSYTNKKGTVIGGKDNCKKA